MPDSSKTSRRTAASNVSPGSTKPAKSEYIPSGQACERPIRTLFPCVISMITTGSVRGKCERLQAGQLRCHPAIAISDGAPQVAQYPWVRCHSKSPRPVAASSASRADNCVIIARNSAKYSPFVKAGCTCCDGSRKAFKVSGSSSGSQMEISAKNNGSLASFSPKKTRESAARPKAG